MSKRVEKSKCKGRRSRWRGKGARKGREMEIIEKSGGGGLRREGGIKRNG